MRNSKLATETEIDLNMLTTPGVAMGTAPYMSMIQVTHGGGSVSSESSDGKWLYFTREEGAESSLWKMPAGGGPEAQVLPFVYNFNFAVMGDGVYFVTRDEHGFAIKFLTFATGKVKLVASIDEGYFGFSVSPDRKWILFVQTNPSESELMLAEGFR
jgi:dipeptidyl aminopeptidase/acylaminoacyl peptidase